ncbi:MAG: glycosyltransferase family 2 protein [Desulfuromonadales bacterium]|nr:glycosyltransferase family 2 protein [Desulfuromonadales bacterium]
MIEIILFISMLLVFYVYVGYPLAAALLGHVMNRPVRKGICEPMVTIVIAAYNEEESIGATIENKLALEYPREKLEIQVISDGSTDGTDAIVGRFEVQGVRLLRQGPRAGKTSALNLAIPQARGEIIVFSDANSIYAPDALRKLVSNFSDPEVGYVTGKMIYANPDGTTIGDGCSAYMKYENWLRETETRLGSVVGVDGGIDAMRREIYQSMNPDQLPDFVQPLKVVEQGYRVVYEPEALLWESSLKEAGDEYRMRVRVSLRAFWALFDMRTLLLPWPNSIFAWQLWSHKILRYLCFVFLILAYTSNILLLGDGFMYLILFALQSACYTVAFTAPVLERIGMGSRVITFARYFLLLNIAAAHAFGKFILGKKQVLWTPRKG